VSKPAAQAAPRLTFGLNTRRWQHQQRITVREFAFHRRIDAAASSARTRAQLGWTPQQPGLIADLDHPAYFAPG
jgi:hypothetical protein